MPYEHTVALQASVADPNRSESIISYSFNVIEYDCTLITNDNALVMLANLDL